MITLPVTCNDIKFGLLIAFALGTAWLLYEGYFNDNFIFFAIGASISIVSLIVIIPFTIFGFTNWIDNNVRCMCEND